MSAIEFIFGCALIALQLVFAVVYFKRISRWVHVVAGCVALVGMIFAVQGLLDRRYDAWHVLILVFLPPLLVYVAWSRVQLEFGIDGQQSWEIAGKNYSIESTYLLRIFRVYQFTIAFRPKDDCDVMAMDDDSVRNTALPLIIHAFDTGKYCREHGAAPVNRVARIGVELLGRGKRGPVSRRFGLSVDEVEKLSRRTKAERITEPKA